MKHTFRLFITGFFLFIMIAACKSKQESIHPSIEKITQSVYASGTVKSNGQYDVYSKVNGVVAKVLVKEGELVKKGQAIIQINNTAQVLSLENAKLLASYSSEKTNTEKLSQAQTELEVAKLKLETETSLLERQKKLWASEIGTKNELDQRTLSYQNALSAFNASKLKLNDLKKQIDFQSQQTQKTAAISSSALNDYIVRTDIDGRVYGINKLEGEMATTQAPIAVVGNANQFYIELQVDEYDIAKMQIGQKVILTMDSHKGQVYEAVVKKIYPLMDQKSKSFKIDAYFTKQPENLFPNLSAEANIVIATKEKALTIPRGYLVDNESVLLANKEKRKVKVGLMDYEKAEIISGINNTDELVKPIK